MSSLNIPSAELIGSGVDMSTPASLSKSIGDFEHPLLKNFI